MEDELTEAFDRIVSQGAQRLHRTWREVLTTGLAGGLEVATGVVALLAVYAATGSHLLAGLAFSIGFVALMLAKSELFTEGFLVPVTAVGGRPGGGRPGGQGWGGAAGAHLGRGWWPAGRASASWPSWGPGRWSPTSSVAGWSCGWSCTASRSSARPRSSRVGPSSRRRWT